MSETGPRLPARKPRKPKKGTRAAKAKKLAEQRAGVKAHVKARKSSKRKSPAKRVGPHSPNPYYKRKPCPPCKEPSRTQGTHRNKLMAAAKACGGTKTKHVKRAAWILCMKRAKT